MFQKRRTKEINHSVERNKRKLPEGTNFLWALQTWAPRPPSWLKWTATACVFFVLFLPQGTGSFIFRGCVTTGRTFQGRVTSNGILKLSLRACCPRWPYCLSLGSGTLSTKFRETKLTLKLLCLFCLIDWLVVFCLLVLLCGCGFLSFFSSFFPKLFLSDCILHNSSVSDMCSQHPPTAECCGIYKTEEFIQPK